MSTFVSKRSASVGTVATKVGGYTVASGKTDIAISMTAANVTAAPVKVSAYVSDGTNIFYLVKDAPVSAGRSEIIIGGEAKQVLNAGDSIYVVSDTGTSIDVCLSIVQGL